MARARIVLSVYPDDRRSERVRTLLASLGSGWRHEAVTGQAARNLLDAAQQLQSAIANEPIAVRLGHQLSQHADFCRTVSATLDSALVPGARYLVVAPTIVLLDAAVHTSGQNVGDLCPISHLITGERPPREAELARALEPSRRPAGRYVLVCPMAMDRLVPRNEQDIVTVALALEQLMPVELWLQPTLQHAMQAFASKDVAWLHLDTHGTWDGQSIMLGPTRRNAEYVRADALPRVVRPPLVVACGCALNGYWNSIGPTLQRRGAVSVLGPCATFQSLGVANSEEGEAQWYRSFFNSLAAGKDVGTSLIAARHDTPGGLLKYAWVVVGSSQLQFSATSR